MRFVLLLKVLKLIQQRNSCLGRRSAFFLQFYNKFALALYGGLGSARLRSNSKTAAMAGCLRGRTVSTRTRPSVADYGKEGAGVPGFLLSHVQTARNIIPPPE